MGAFAETANVDYCLSFADQRQQTSVFRFQKTNGSLPFLFSVCSQLTEVAIFRETAAYIYTRTAYCLRIVQMEICLSDC
jgi:hypothetical protein